MNEDFDFQVTHDKKEQHFTGRLLSWGYSYKIEVEVLGIVVTFEPDEERNLRAMTDPSQKGSLSLDPSLMQAIARALENLGK